MDDIKGKDSFVVQLMEAFEYCDVFGEGHLNESGLRMLCFKLQLAEHANVINNLLKDNLTVSFDDCKNYFIHLLSQSVLTSEVSETGNEELADREISPKFTFGRKKYGRRSRPASVADDDGSASCDISPVTEKITDFSNSANSSTTLAGENVPGKRPMSPNDCQQPPSKSGRMRDVQEVSYASSLPSSESEPSFETNPVEFLQETWKKLGIGQNGYLNVEELACIGKHIIGMDMTEEVVVQLFQKLDSDQDGQISFDEFLQGIFQDIDPQQCEILTLRSNSMFNQGYIDENQISNIWPAGIFSSIDANNTGTADASSILELWESLELPCPPRLLEDLGFNVNSKISLSDLTSTLEEILDSAMKRPILQLVFATFQNEMQFLRQTVIQMQDERKRLRVNIEEANARAALLAQEVDDNHAKLENSLQKKLILAERKYQDQIRQLIDELQQERDMSHSQATKIKQYQQELALTQEEENKVKARFDILQQENIRVEQELREMSERNLATEKLNESLQKEVATIPDLKKKISELESQLLQEQQNQCLLLQLEKCKKSNQELQDKIDELTLEMENIQRNTLPDVTPLTGVTRNHSWLSDYKNTSSEYKRRGSESSVDGNSDEENGSFPSGEKMSKDEHSDEIKQQTESAGDDYNTPINHSSTSVDILLKDMFLDQSIMMQKLQVAEEKFLKADRERVHAEQKNKLLNQLLRNMACNMAV